MDVSNGLQFFHVAGVSANAFTKLQLQPRVYLESAIYNFHAAAQLKSIDLYNYQHNNF